jgi:4-hydroxy-L-threonine phosphate dehydrogenase PdxA
MMLVAPKLRVIHVTTHIGLLDAINRIEPGLVQRTIERAHDTLVRAGITQPRIGVCGINPHAGENGLFGYGEEEKKIIPAVELLKRAAGTWKARCRPTPCSIAPAVATSTWWWPCITTRATARSR